MGTFLFMGTFLLGLLMGLLMGRDMGPESVKFILGVPLWGPFYWVPLWGPFYWVSLWEWDPSL